jgi:hypothetical protein
MRDDAGDDDGDIGGYLQPGRREHHCAAWCGRLLHLRRTCQDIYCHSSFSLVLFVLIQ